MLDKLHNYNDICLCLECKMKRKAKELDFSEEIPLNLVKEELVNYMTIYDVAMTNSIERMELARKGINKSKLISLSEKMGISVAELADILHISPRTIQRYDDKDLLDTHTSEHIMLIDKLYTYSSLKVFNNTQQFSEWMKKELFDFNFKKPISMLDTYTGIEMVSDKLGQFQHGIFV